jgi:hypothetical protein
MGAVIPPRDNRGPLTSWICIPEGQLTKVRSFALVVCGVAALAFAAPAFAQHGGAAVARGGAYGGGYRGGYYGGYRSGYYGGYRGYYGYRGWYGGYYPWGWGWGGVGLGLYFATLPYYYSTYWYGGIPYYYADNTYFLWNPAVGQYRTVAPPAGAPNRPAEQAPSELMVYPKSGQSENQQITDRYECYRWAVSQLGYDPTSAGGGTVRRDLTDYDRAQTACLVARGYSVK